MTKILCPCVECIYHGEKNNVCKAKDVKLTFRNMATVNEGRVDMWICNKYELSEFAKAIEKNIEKAIKTL